MAFVDDAITVRDRLRTNLASGNTAVQNETNQTVIADTMTLALATGILQGLEDLLIYPKSPDGKPVPPDATAEEVTDGTITNMRLFSPALIRLAAETFGGPVAWEDVTGKPAAFPPTTHTHTLADITDAGTAAARSAPTVGNAAAGEVVLGDDTRLTDARVPEAHASTHATAGTDPITPVSIDAANRVHNHAWTDLTSGVPTAFPPATHQHTVADVTDVDLSAAADGDLLIVDASTGGMKTRPPNPDKTATFAQAVPAAVWVITHNLGKNPAITVVDSAGSEVKGTTEYGLDGTTVTITFSAPFSGTAYLN